MVDRILNEWQHDSREEKRKKNELNSMKWSLCKWTEQNEADRESETESGMEKCV